jgi:hypothetical protein
MEHNLIFVYYYIEHEAVVLWQNIGPLHQHITNEDTVSDTLSAANTDYCYDDVPDLIEDDFYVGI